MRPNRFNRDTGDTPQAVRGSIRLLRSGAECRSSATHSEPRQRGFGRLLKQCFRQGLPKALYDKIHAFNAQRVAAIHGYLLGLIAYEKLAEVVLESDGLSEELTEFVLLNAGESVTEAFATRYHNRGDAVFHVPALVAHLKSGVSI